MQLPLLHRSTQMAVLKKLVRRKVRELRWRRHRAQRRLEMMRQIRWELLRLMQSLIDKRQRHAEQKRREQARRAMGGMLDMYKRWLGKWTRSLQSQGRLIRRQEQLKRRLNRRLRLLRRRLRKHHRPKQLVDSCFEKLAKAVKRWKRRPDHSEHIEGQGLIWAQEIEEVRSYLSDIRGNSQRRQKSPHRARDDPNIDLPNFWKYELKPKKKNLGKVQASSQETTSERDVYRIPKPPFSSKTYPNLDVDQMRISRRIPARRLGKKDRLVPSLKELHKVFRLITDPSPADSKRKLSRKKAKTKLYQDLKRKPQSQRKRDERNQGSFIMKSLFRIDSAIRSKILQSNPKSSIKSAKKHHWTAMTTLRRRIPIRHKYVKKSISEFVDEKISKEMVSMKMNRKKRQRHINSMKRKNLREKFDLSMSPSQKNSRKPKSKRKELGIKNKKSHRRGDSMESKNLSDSSGPSKFSSQKKPQSKFVEEKIRTGIKALDIKSKTGRRRKESKESKNPRDSSDPTAFPTQEHARKPESKIVVEKIWKEMGKDTQKSPRDSRESKSLRDNSDRTAFPSQEPARKSESKIVGKKKWIEMGKDTQKSPRDSRESKNLWDSSDLSGFPLQQHARKPESKIVDEKIRKEMGKDTQKSPRDSRESKNLWESSDPTAFPSQEHARRPESKKVGEKIRKKMGKDTQKSPRDSRESKNLWDSSDLSGLPLQEHARKPESKNAFEKIRKEIEKDTQKSPRDSRESKNLWDSSDLSEFLLQEHARMSESKYVGENIRKEMGKNTQKSPRDSKESKNLWDSSDPSVFPSQEHARKPESKVVGKKIRIEMGKNTQKSPWGSKESKNLWDSSDTPNSPSQKHALKPEFKIVNEKIRKEMGKNTQKSPKESRKSKILWESSDPSVFPSHKRKSKVADEEMPENESLNVCRRKSYRRWDSVDSENLWDSNDFLAPGSRFRRSRKFNKKMKESLSSQCSDDGTDIMVNKLLNRKQLFETSASDQIAERDSVASFSDSLKQLMMESRHPRKSTRKSSIFGWGLLPVGSKISSKHRTSTDANLRRNSNRDSLTGSSRSMRSTRKSSTFGLGLHPVSSKTSSKPRTSTEANLRRTLNTDSLSRSSRSRRSTRFTARSVASTSAGSSKRSLNVDTNRRGTIRTAPRRRGTVASEVSRNDPIVVQSKDKLGISDQKVNETDNTTYNTKDHELGKQDKTNAVPEALKFIKVNEDTNKSATKISFSVNVTADHQTHYQDVSNTSPFGDLKKDRKSSRQDMHHSRSESINEVGLNHKKEEGHQEHHHSLVPIRYPIQNLQSDAKYKQIQYFLKDVIETNPTLEEVPDVEGLMKVVGNHYMWDNLKDLYSELLAGGIGKADVKRLLTDKYLNYLKTVRKSLILSPKNVGFTPEGKKQETRKESNSDHIRNFRLWHRHRMNMRPLPPGKTNDKDEVPSQRTSQQKDSTVYNNLIVQGLKAERSKREIWDERLRRLLPTNETSASTSFNSNYTMWDVEPEEEEALGNIDKRYSVTNLNKMMKELEVRFQAKERERQMQKARQGQVDPKDNSVGEPTMPKKLSRQSSKKREKNHPRPINQLYYSPRKTCRVQQIIKFYSEYSEDEQDEALKEESEYQDSCVEKCPKCGVEVEQPCCVPTPKASSAILSSGSIEACAKNELLVNTMADVCTRCGYVHDQANPCSQPPEDRRKTLLLRMIKAVQAVRSTTQPTQCSEFCSCREILRSYKSKLLTQVESRVRDCPGADEGGGDR